MLAYEYYSTTINVGDTYLHLANPGGEVITMLNYTPAKVYVKTVLIAKLLTCPECFYIRPTNVIFTRIHVISS